MGYKAWKQRIDWGSTERLTLVSNVKGSLCHLGPDKYLYLLSIRDNHFQRWGISLTVVTVHTHTHTCTHIGILFRQQKKEIILYFQKSFLFPEVPSSLSSKFRYLCRESASFPCFCLVTVKTWNGGPVLQLGYGLEFFVLFFFLSCKENRFLLYYFFVCVMSFYYYFFFIYFY